MQDTEMKTGTKILILIVTILVAIGISLSLYAYERDKASLGNLVGIITFLLTLISVLAPIFSNRISTTKEPVSLNKRWIAIVCVLIISIPAISYFFLNQNKEHAQPIDNANSNAMSVFDSAANNTKDVSPHPVGTSSSSEQKEKVSSAKNATALSQKNIDEATKKSSPIEETPTLTKLESNPNDLLAEHAYQEGKDAAQKNNYTKAKDYYQSAADRGIPAAAYELALLYQKGKGITKDEFVAFKYMKIAAESGYVNAFRPLGEMYHGGRGVTKNKKVAENWYKKAAALGDEVAKEILSNMW